VQVHQEIMERHLVAGCEGNPHVCRDGGGQGEQSLVFELMQGAPACDKSPELVAREQRRMLNGVNLQQAASATGCLGCINGMIARCVAAVVKACAGP
jgi:hypothetical protein